jgi:poly(3-hydroxybutyrate) depolymerase
MLYQWFEAQRALMSPFAEFASASSKLFSNQLSPFAAVPGAQRVAASFDLINRLAREYEKPEFNIRSVMVGEVDVAVQERVALNKPFCRLLRFKRFSDDAQTLATMKDQPVVLVVAPLSGHHSTLLRETVRALLKDHKVYITDWTDARMIPTEAGPFHLADYVHYVQDFIRHIGEKVNVISVCQPTVPVLAAISLMATAGEKTPLTMTMMGGPIDARNSPTAVNNLAMNKSHEWFENNVIYRVPVNYPGCGRQVYPGFLQHSGFIAMNPDRHLKSHYDYFLDLVRGDDSNADFHREFYDEYNAVLDMPAEYYLDTIKVVFQDFSLVNGTWEIDGQLVCPQDITTSAMLTIEGELDDISGAGQTKAAHGLCTGVPASRKFHYDVEGAGHYGIFSGRRWREKVYPVLKDFIAQHQVALSTAAPDTASDDASAGAHSTSRRRKAA